MKHGKALYRSLLIAFISTLGLSGCVVVVGDQPDWHQQEYVVNHSADGLTQVHIQADSSHVEVIGTSQDQNIEIITKLMSGKGHFNPQQFISVNKQGEILNIHASKPMLDSQPWHGPIELKIIVKLPSHLNVVIDQGQGDIQVRDLNSLLFIEDTSGDIEVSNILGQVSIDDFSGDIRVNNVMGSLSLTDDAGEIYIDNVAGEVQIDDGSGDIQAQNIGGTLSVVDGSGNIDVEQVFDFQLIEKDSGLLRHNGLVVNNTSF